MSGKHSTYEVKNIEQIIIEWLNNRPESATHKVWPGDSGQEKIMKCEEEELTIRLQNNLKILHQSKIVLGIQ